MDRAAETVFIYTCVPVSYLKFRQNLQPPELLGRWVSDARKATSPDTKEIWPQLRSLAQAGLHEWV